MKKKREKSYIYGEYKKEFYPKEMTLDEELARLRRRYELQRQEILRKHGVIE